MSTELSPIDDAMNLQLVGEPDKIMERAEKACKVLMEIVKKRKLYIDIGKARHLKVEAWITLAHFYGVTPRVVSVCSVTDEMTGHSGFEATVEAIHLQSGRIIGQAVARCLNNEDNWSTRPKYDKDTRKQIGSVAVPSFQLESMAQTRATSKVLASLFRWVVVLGGVEGTPAEELGGESEAPQKESAGAKKITEGQRKRIFAIAKEHAVPMNDLPAIWQRHGFNTAADITQDKYDAIVTEVQNSKAQAAP
jgi:hypothetical protein